MNHLHIIIWRWYDYGIFFLEMSYQTLKFFIAFIEFYHLHTIQVLIYFSYKYYSRWTFVILLKLFCKKWQLFRIKQTIIYFKIHMVLFGENILFTNVRT